MKSIMSCIRLGIKNSYIARLVFFISGLAPALTVFAAGDTNRQSFLLGIVPQYESVKTLSAWTPVATALSASLNAEVRLKVYKDFGSFQSDLSSGRLDFAYVNPHQATVGKRTQGYIPIVRDADRRLQGLLVVKKDSPIKKLRDLQDKDVAFPAPTAFAASIYLRYMLQGKEKVSFNPVYVGTHNNSYRAVLMESAAAGGGAHHTLSSEAPDVRDAVRVLYTTPDFVSHPIVVHPRVSKATRERVMSALQALTADETGRQMLKNIEMNNPIAAHYQKDYASLEAIGSRWLE